MTHTAGAPNAFNLGAVKVRLEEFVTQGNAILGIRGSGKSFTATYCAEQLLLHDIPFVAFDPIGVWRYLRHRGPGRDGFQVLVAGGENGDVELTASNAIFILEHALKNQLPLIFDLYDVRISKADWRRIVETSVRHLLYNNKEYGPRHLFFEEAAEFVPQIVRSDDGRCYAEMEKLARMGGNAMLGYTIINQRAEEVNKAVLELCEMLVLHRQKGRRSLTALGKWLDVSGQISKRVVAEMPTLEAGECYIWSTGEVSAVKTQVGKKLTFHPNRRQMENAGKPVPVPHMLKGLEFPAEKPHRDRTSEAAERVKAVLAAKVSAPEPQIVKVPVFATGELAKLDRIVRDLDASISAAQRVSTELHLALKQADMLTERKHVPAPKIPPVRESGKPTVMSSGPLKILKALAARHPARLTQSQVGTIAVFTPSTMRTYLPALREGGLIDENRDGMTITEAGLVLAGTDTTPMPTRGEPLLRFWQSKLSGGESKVLGCICRYAAISMEDLRKHTDFTDSTLRTYLPTLLRNNLVKREGDLIVIADDLVI